MFYRFWYELVGGLARLVFGVRIVGAERLPRDGAYIVAPSHRSVLDIPFAALITRRRLRFMAKRELFEKRFWAWAFRELGAVAVDRHGNDRAALKAMEAALREGEPVVIFPEGTRHEGPLLGPLASGVSYLALKVGVPIVPVGIGGSDRVLVSVRGVPWFSRVTVVVGEPIPVAEVAGTVKRSAITDLDAELRTRLQGCFDEARARSAARSAGAGRGGEPGEGV